MNSVYDAAKTHAEKLKAELEALQAFLTLHDHFRDRFGLTPSAATSQAQAPVVDQAEATHELHVQEPQVDAETPVQAHAPELEASESDPPEHEAVQHEAVEHDARLHAANGTEAPATASAEAASDLEPHVINASEGVLIVAPVEAESAAPLGAEATLQSVAEKLAATISASHPSVTGYTV